MLSHLMAGCIHLSGMTATLSIFLACLLNICVSLWSVSADCLPVVNWFLWGLAVELLELIIYPGDQSIVAYIADIFSRSAGGIRVSPLLRRGSLGVFDVTPSAHLFSLGCLCGWSPIQSSFAQPMPGSIFLSFRCSIILGLRLGISQMMSCVLHMVREDLSHFLCIWIVSFSSTVCWWKFSFL